MIQVDANIKEVNDFLDATEKGINTELESWAKDTASDLKLKAQEQLVADGHVVTGRLLHSIQDRVSGMVVEVGSDVEYAGKIEARDSFLQKTAERNKDRWITNLQNRINKILKG